MNMRYGFTVAAYIASFLGMIWFCIRMIMAIWNKPYNFGILSYVPWDAWVSLGIGFLLFCVSADLRR